MRTINAIKTELDALYAKRDAHNVTHNEGGYGYNPYDAKIQAAHEELRAAKDADIIARYDELKAAWNAEIAKVTGPKGVAMADLKKVEEKVGITLIDIKRIRAIVEGR